MSVGKKARFEIFKRDGFTCRYCGRTPPEVVLHVDHIVAVANGGPDDDSNLITSCCDCNLGKGAVPMDLVRAPLNIDVAVEEEKLEQLRRYSELRLKQVEILEKSVSFITEHWANCEGQDHTSAIYMADLKVKKAVKVFLKKLDLKDIIEAVDIAFAKGLSEYNTFKYFCGVCWKMINEHHESKPPTGSQPTGESTGETQSPVEGVVVEAPGAVADGE